MVKNSLKIAALVSVLILTGCSSDAGNDSSSENSDAEVAVAESIVVYSGRNETFIKPYFDEFELLTGIKVEARYGDSAELAAQLLEEGTNSPADVFLSQDAGAIGAVAAAGLLQEIASDRYSAVPSQFTDPNGFWTGITGRARVVAYDSELIDAQDVPTKIDGLLQPQWRGLIGIAPTNASFQSFVTAMRQVRGDDATLEWLKGIAANEPVIFEKNSQMIEALDAKVIGLSLTNHYYLYEVAESLGKELNVKNGFFEAGDVGNLLNVSALGILNTSDKLEAAYALLDYLLSNETQQRFVTETSEYSILPGINPPGGMPKLEDLGVPDVRLGDLSDIKRTQELLIEAGLL